MKSRWLLLSLRCCKGKFLMDKLSLRSLQIQTFQLERAFDVSEEHRDRCFVTVNLNEEKLIRILKFSAVRATQES